MTNKKYSNGTERLDNSRNAILNLCTPEERMPRVAYTLENARARLEESCGYVQKSQENDWDSYLALGKDISQKYEDARSVLREREDSIRNFDDVMKENDTQSRITLFTKDGYSYWKGEYEPQPTSVIKELRGTQDLLCKKVLRYMEIWESAGGGKPYPGNIIEDKASVRGYLRNKIHIMSRISSRDIGEIEYYQLLEGDLPIGCSYQTVSTRDSMIIRVDGIHWIAHYLPRDGEVLNRRSFLPGSERHVFTSEDYSSPNIRGYYDNNHKVALDLALPTMSREEFGIFKQSREKDRQEFLHEHRREIEENKRRRNPSQ
jgi:hypothetical protein